MTISSTYGFGRDMTAIIEEKGTIDGMEAITKAILYSAIGQTILVIGTVLSKTSLALFLLRLVTTRRDKIAIWVPAFFLATGVVASLFVFWFSCQPTAYLWDRRLDGECTVDPGPISTYAGSWSVILDFWYAAFPWYLLWKLQMPQREKWIIASSMSLGVFAGACGIKRAIELQKLGSANYLKDIVGIIIWHAAEMCTTMACIGIPVCRPLYKDWFAAWTSARRSGEETSGGSGWLKQKNNESGNGVFAMHTIGGTELKPKQNINSNTRHHGSGASTEDVILRKDIPQSRQRNVSVGRTSPDNESEESILGPEYRNRQRVAGRAGIKITKEFQVEAHRA